MRDAGRLARYFPNRIQEGYPERKKVATKGERLISVIRLPPVTLTVERRAAPFTWDRRISLRAKPKPTQHGFSLSRPSCAKRPEWRRATKFPVPSRPSLVEPTFENFEGSRSSPPRPPNWITAAHFTDMSVSSSLPDVQTCISSRCTFTPRCRIFAALDGIDRLSLIRVGCPLQVSALHCRAGNIRARRN